MDVLFSDNQQLGISKRLKDLRKDKNLSHVSLSKALGESPYNLEVSKDSLIKYEVSDTFHSSFGAIKGMAAKTLFCLAKFYGVSSDYLLCNTDIKNPKPEMKLSCDYTGLSEKSINAIKNLENNDNISAPYLNILNTLHEEGFITELTEVFSHFLFLAITRKNRWKFDDEQIPDDVVMDMASWHLNNKISDAVEDIKTTMIENYKYFYMDDLMEDLP